MNFECYLLQGGSTVKERKYQARNTNKKTFYRTCKIACSHNDRTVNN